MNKYLSKKEYLEKYDSNVGYALYVEDNIKRDNYARLNTGQIVRVIGIKENKLNKKAIYYGIYEQDWFDSMAVENFSDKPIDLIEVGDYVNGHLVVEISKNAYNQKIVITEVDGKDGAIRHHYLERSIKNVVTHEQFESIEFKVEEKVVWKKN